MNYVLVGYKIGPKFISDCIETYRKILKRYELNILNEKCPEWQPDSSLYCLQVKVLSHNCRNDYIFSIRFNFL
jgi:hypothetical protein